MKKFSFCKIHRFVDFNEMIRNANFGIFAGILGNQFFNLLGSNALIKPKPVPKGRFFCCKIFVFM